jgi:hypothetical protein
MGNDAVLHASPAALLLQKLAAPMLKEEEQTAMVLSTLKKETAVEKRNSNLKKIAIFTSLINFILSIIL